LIIISKNQVKKIDKLIFSYIWGDAIERIKRKTLILPYEYGGLNMVSVSDKLNTILITNYLYLIKNIERMSYQYCVFWCKFNLKEYLNKNFNIIPCGDVRSTPLYYKELFKCIKNYKLINKNFDIEKSKLKSKKIYNDLIILNGIKPYIFKNNNEEAMKKVFLKLKLIKDSDVRSVNYKLLLDALPLNNKFNKNKINKCLFCKEKNESRDHVFTECEYVSTLFDKIRRKLIKGDLKVDEAIIIYGMNINDIDYLNISLFKYIIFKIRNKLLKNENLNVNNLFLKYYYIYFK
jgi:hypothetical protein